MTIENFIIAAKSLLQIIIDAIRAETDDNLSKTIRDSARLSADIIKTAQETIFQVTWFDRQPSWNFEKKSSEKLNSSEFASTVKPPLQKCYLECLEFLIFRALPVIMPDELQQRIDIIQSNIVSIATVAVLVKVAQVKSLISKLSL